MRSLRDREVACSVSELQFLYFESCIWRAVSSHSIREKDHIKHESLHQWCFNSRQVSWRCTTSVDSPRIIINDRHPDVIVAVTSVTWGNILFIVFMLRLQYICSLRSATMGVKVNTHLMKLIYIAALDEIIYADLLDSDDLIIDKILCNDNPY